MGKGVHEGPPKAQSDHHPEEYNRAYWKADQTVSESQSRWGHIFLRLLGTGSAAREGYVSSGRRLGRRCGCNGEPDANLVPQNLETNGGAGARAYVVHPYHDVIIVVRVARVCVVVLLFVSPSVSLSLSLSLFFSLALSLSRRDISVPSTLE